ncbi:MAG: peroxiredoxin [Paracoccaceae bacterium]|nr:peroxiredoxin [Paracoccaceae bacterium]
MPIAVGDKIPSAKLLNRIGDEVREIDIADHVAGKKVVLFGLPGAYTRTCSATHLPSFIRTAEAFRAKGVDDIICVSVNDVFVMQHWGETSGAEKAGILMLADWDSRLSDAMGLTFTGAPVGLKNRMTRCAMLIEDGVVKVLQMEAKAGVCDMTAGETLLEQV